MQAQLLVVSLVVERQQGSAIFIELGFLLHLRAVHDAFIRFQVPGFHLDKLHVVVAVAAGLANVVSFVPGKVVDEQAV